MFEITSPGQSKLKFVDMTLYNLIKTKTIKFKEIKMKSSQSDIFVPSKFSLTH